MIGLIRETVIQNIGEMFLKGEIGSGADFGWKIVVASEGFKCVQEPLSITGRFAVEEEFQASAADALHFFEDAVLETGHVESGIHFGRRARDEQFFAAVFQLPPMLQENTNASGTEERCFAQINVDRFGTSFEGGQDFQLELVGSLAIDAAGNHKLLFVAGDVFADLHGDEAI